MRAARWHARGDVRIEDVPVPVVRAPHELVLAVEWCGICGSDLEEYRSGPISVPVTPHPRRGSAAPIVLGHEFVGRVHTAADDGTGPAVGTLVVPDVVLGCGECRWCLRHEEGLCETLAVRGQTEDGGLARYAVADARTCLVVPDGVTAQQAALVEPASVAVRAIRKLDAVIGARVAVVGGGTIGQLVARVALAAGATVGLVVDTRASRRELAERSGVARGLSPDEAAALVDPRAGFDAVFECSGADGALALAIDLTRRGGTIVALGIRADADRLDSTALVLTEKRILGSAAHLWDEDSAPALNLIAEGRVLVDDLITHRIPLDEVVAGGFEMLGDPGRDVLKVLVDCRG
ncbi:alcohol dehydrogenase catalytic domain-containing protein [Promicromonospora sp. Populi]|uniref:alcohol dehydrogenase catalytic domain-containing protein n=1 Tax=Promicromonospora sp. Populi TaxID=3239420 RepID=UPI0034E1EB8B